MHKRRFFKNIYSEIVITGTTICRQNVQKVVRSSDHKFITVAIWDGSFERISYHNVCCLPYLPSLMQTHVVFHQMTECMHT